MRNIYRKTVAIIAASVAMAFTPAALAAGSLPTGTGSAAGNYYSMADDIKNYCDGSFSGGYVLDVQESTGSTENLTGIMDKKFALGIVQVDVLQYFSRKMPNRINESTIKAVAGLHDEPLHILIPNDWKPSGGGFFSNLFGGDEGPMDVNTLKDQTVGAWGGSLISAKALNMALGLNMNVVEVPQESANKVKIPMVIVGGAPYAPVEHLLATKKWTLVGLDAADIKQRAPFYNPATLTYSIGGKIKAIPSVSVQAVMVGKSFRNKSRNKPMTELATCITGSIADLADDYDTNPNWGSVYEFIEAGGQTSWPMFDIDEQALSQMQSAW